MRSLLLALLLLPAGAFGQTKERNAARDGIEAYGRGDYDLAIRKLDEASAGLALLEVPEQVTVHKYSAYTLMAFNRKDEAKARFKSAVVLDPSLALPDTVPPKIRDVFTAAKAELEAEKKRAETQPVPEENKVVEPPVSRVAQPGSAGRNELAIRLQTAFPVGGGFGRTDYAYGLELGNDYEIERVRLGIAFGYRHFQHVEVAEGSPNIYADEYYGDLTVAWMLKPSRTMRPYLGGGIGMHFVDAHLETTDDRKTGFGGWAGAGVVLFPDAEVHLVPALGFMVDGFPIDDRPTTGVLLQLSVTYRTGARPCCM